MKAARCVSGILVIECFCRFGEEHRFYDREGEFWFRAQGSVVRVVFSKGYRAAALCIVLKSAVHSVFF